MLKDKKKKKSIKQMEKKQQHSFPLQEEATEQTPHVDSACLFNFSLCMQS